MAKDTPNNEQNIDTRLIEYFTPVELRPGVYSNALTVNNSNVDVTLNFIYLNPSDEPNGTLVSRVIVTHEGADNLVDVLQRAKAQFQKAKEDAEQN